MEPILLRVVSPSRWDDAQGLAVEKTHVFVLDDPANEIGHRIPTDYAGALQESMAKGKPFICSLFAHNAEGRAYLDKTKTDLAMEERLLQVVQWETP